MDHPLNDIIESVQIIARISPITFLALAILPIIAKLIETIGTIRKHITAKRELARKIEIQKDVTSLVRALSRETAEADTPEELNRFLKLLIEGFYNVEPDLDAKSKSRIKQAIVGENVSADKIRSEQ